MLKQVSSTMLLSRKSPTSASFALLEMATMGLFHIDEISIGKEISCDNDFVVHEIKALHFRQDSYDQDVQLTRNLMAEQLSNKHDKYSIKTMKKDSFEDSSHEQFERVAERLENEATVMAMAKHKCIAKLRGISASGTEGYYQMGRHDAFFIITDSFPESLCTKLQSWRRNQRKFSFRRSPKTSTIRERLQIAYAIADAMEYLHSHDIIHRRIHPKSVGFNILDQVQVHGMEDAVRILPRKSKRSIPKTRYNPNDRYANKASDVYAFSKMLCEIITLCAINEKGVPENPSMYLSECEYWARKLPKSLFETVHDGLSEEVSKRPTMSEIKSSLDQALFFLEASDEKIHLSKESFHVRCRLRNSSSSKCRDVKDGPIATSAKDGHSEAFETVVGSTNSSCGV